jgi:hypothetical protein
MRVGHVHAAVAALSLLAGWALPAAGWLFCRRPGVPLGGAWAPLWRAGEYLTVTGVVLWLAGLPALALGAALVLIATRDGAAPRRAARPCSRRQS